MPKKGHTEEQIVAVLWQVEAGAKVAEVCRKVGISEATYYYRSILLSGGEFNILTHPKAGAGLQSSPGTPRAEPNLNAPTEAVP